MVESETGQEGQLSQLDQHAWPEVVFDWKNRYGETVWAFMEGLRLACVEGGDMMPSDKLLSEMDKFFSSGLEPEKRFNWLHWIVSRLEPRFGVSEELRGWMEEPEYLKVADRLLGFAWEKLKGAEWQRMPEPLKEFYESEAEERVNIYKTRKAFNRMKEGGMKNLFEYMKAKMRRDLLGEVGDRGGWRIDSLRRIELDYNSVVAMLLGVSLSLAERGSEQAARILEEMEAMTRLFRGTVELDEGVVVESLEQRRSEQVKIWKMRGTEVYLGYGVYLQLMSLVGGYGKEEKQRLEQFFADDVLESLDVPLLKIEIG